MDRIEALMICLRLFIFVTGATFGLTSSTHAGNTRPFVVADEIGLTLFSEPGRFQRPMAVSPSGGLVAVWAERGLLAENRLEDEIRIYDVSALKRFANDATRRTLDPFWIIRRGTYNEAPIISDIRWLSDSSAIVFTAKTEAGRRPGPTARVVGQNTEALTT